jgi:hypothetical protein
MYHPVMAHEYAKSRQQDVLRQAEQRRMVRQARKAQAARPNFSDRIADEMGSLLIDAGQRLKARHISPNGKAIG